MSQETINKAIAELRRIKKDREELEQEDAADTKASLLAMQIAMNEDLIDSIDEQTQKLDEIITLLKEKVIK